MRRYSELDEERIRAQTRVREWTRARLLDPSQCTRLEAELRVDVRRTNDFLRAGLGLFTALIVGASLLLLVEVFDLKHEIPNAVATGAAALVCVALADLLVGELRFYRFGVEEALAVAAVVLLSISGAGLTATFEMNRGSQASMVVALLIGAAGGFGIYRRFGFVYAAVGSMACAALIPFQLHLSAMTQHILAAVTLAAVFLIVRSKRLRYQDEYPGDEYGQLQAAAWAGIYVALNVKLAWDHVDGWFYWFTYVMTLVLPVVGLRLGIREKDRALLDVGIVMALVTLLTNKPYLGWPRHTWDPVLLGVFLMVIAVVLRRWLSIGPGGERGGFTPARILSSDARVLSVLRATSNAFQPDTPSPRPDPRPPDFDGGRSGGGGGGAAF